MYIVNEEDKEYRFGDSGPKYLMKGPRMNFALVQFQAGQDFRRTITTSWKRISTFSRARWISSWTAW